VSAPWLLLAGTVAVVLVMTGLWLLGIRQRNFSYVDIGWSANFALLALVYGLLGSGDPGRRLLIGLMFALWGLRLAWHLGQRILGEPEEGRYVELRRKWGAGGEAALNRRMYRFFLLQAALNVFLSLPLLIASLNPEPSIQPLEWLGFVIWLVGLGGESLADRQLALFKSDRGNKGRVCAVGLWRYSRHPNYFFEWTIWIAYATFALASPPWGYAGLLMPALMLHFLLNVTGVRATEDQALRSKGEAYRDYQARTSAFVPWPPRSAAPRLQPPDPRGPSSP
jgi:steroid 5-alpha reductase family enzyme